MSSKSRAGALVLALFLGHFGAHRFYVGKNGTGIIMLLLTISFIGLIVSLIWALVDVFVIATGNFTDKDGDKVTTW